MTDAAPPSPEALAAAALLANKIVLVAEGRDIVARALDDFAAQAVDRFATRLLAPSAIVAAGLTLADNAPDGDGPPLAFLELAMREAIAAAKGTP